MFKSKQQRLSVIVIGYNMQRELPRTIYSLLPPYQNEISLKNIEIIVVDNGSNPPIKLDGFPDNVKYCYLNDSIKSPVKAINYGLKMAKHDLIGVMIDGARMASPGILSKVLLAAKIHHRPIISTYGFHLGPDIQRKSIQDGYNQQVEDKLLQKINWKTNGYQLFEICSFAGSSKNGCFSPMNESNAIFMKKKMWQQLGGYCEAFTSVGGGFANLDLYNRASLLPDSMLITLIGEGTFHQVHGGIATNKPKDSNIDEVYCEEYIRIRNEPFKPINREPIYFGKLPVALKNSKLWTSIK